MSSQRKRRARSEAAPPLEYSLLLTATLCLLAFGAVMVFSSSSARSLLAEGGDGVYYFKRTVIFAAIGLVVMQLLSRRGAAVVRVLTPALVVVSIVGLLAVLIPGVGHSVNGSQRWIGAGFFQVQPAELAKIAVVLYGAHLLAAEPKLVRSARDLRPFLIVAGLCCLLIAAEPDLGSTMVCGFGAFCLLVAAGTRLRTLAVLGAAVVLLGLVVISLNPYQQERLTGFLDPAAERTGSGFQGTQAQIALGSGGLFGVGLGESVQKASYLPEAHTDMIAAVIGEEVGLIGVATLIGLFGLFGWSALRAAHRSRDRYSKLIAAGLASLILAQAAVNLFAVLGLAPLTGVTLPFVSYGGSSLIVTLAAAGLLLNVARHAGTERAARPRRTGTRRSAPRAERSAGNAKLRVLDGGANRPKQRRRAAAAPRGDRGGRNRRTRGSRNRRRRRAAV